MLAKKIGNLSKFRYSLSPSKLEGPHEVILGDFLFSWSKQHVHKVFSPNPLGQVVHNRHVVLKGEKPHPN